MGWFALWMVVGCTHFPSEQSITSVMILRTANLTIQVLRMI
jgi:hypothetical protein